MQCKSNLSKQATVFDPKLATAFPQATAEERRPFKVLKDAYIDARYDQDHQVSREDLEWLGERVAVLRGLVEESCRARIASFG